MHEGTLKHQTWDQASHTWSQRRSPPQPNITVTISAREEDFRAHGHTLARATHHLTTTAMADTGCQSCLAGPSLKSSLHLSENKLIPVSLVMHSASGTNLPILGAALLRIRVQLTGIKTRQMVYFSSMATKLYLSLATCADLGLIPKEFPFSTLISTAGRRPSIRGNPRLTPGNTTSRPTYHGPVDKTPPTPTRTPLMPTHAPYKNGQARGPTRMPTPSTGTTPGPLTIVDRVSTPRQAPPPCLPFPAHAPREPLPLRGPPPSHTLPLQLTRSYLNVTCWTYTQQVRSTYANISHSQ